MIRRALVLSLLFAALVPARADEPLAADAIFGEPRAFTIDSVMTRYTHYDQNGHGYQSQAGPTTFPRVAVGQPGNEYLVVDQPQLEIVAHQGDDVVHRIWIPIDIVTAASPDALDAISTASRTNESGAIQLASNWQATRNSNYGVSGGFHLEEQFRSWNVGVSWARAFADDNALFAVSLGEVYDWFDKFDIEGFRNGRVSRSSTFADVGITQLLSPSTVAHLDYGVTLQNGVLGNTWNAVSLPTGERGGERLPTFRQRHTVMGRLAQYLPWRGALHLSYRFYADDWGVVAHAAEGLLQQRLTNWLYIGATYRVAQQNGAAFFSALPSPTTPLRTSDSDLAPFIAQTVGGSLALDLPMPRIRALHVEFGYEHYWRTNDLAVNVYTSALGVRF